MIQDFVDRFMAREQSTREALASLPCYYSYIELVKLVISAINPDKDYGYPSVDRVHEIDDGDYQGTLVYVIGGEGYQPNDYWAVKVYYGSCSGCDTLQSLQYDVSGDERINGLWTLLVHIVQGLKTLGEDSV